MDAPQYLKERVDDQINWLEGKAASNQTRYKRIRLVQLISSAAIPFLVASLNEHTEILKWVAGGLGVLVTICEGINALYKHQELWLQYRNTAEALKSEKLLFTAKAGKYHNHADPFPAFVAEVEFLLTKDTSEWKKQMETAEKKN